MAWRERPRVLAAVITGALALCLLAGLIGAASSGGTDQRVPLATQRALAAARSDAAHWRQQAAAEQTRATTAARQSAATSRALRHARATARAWKTRALRARRHAHRRVHRHRR